MSKDSLISFRVSKDLHTSLAQIAKEDGRSLSSTIEMVLNNYLKERKAFPGYKKEKRQYPRKSLAVSAVINQPEPGHIGVGSITDISLGGLKVLIPKDFNEHIMIDSQKSKFEIIFNLPDDHKPIRMSCESNRVIDGENTINIGASFVDGDFKNYKTLQSYLM